MKENLIREAFAETLNFLAFKIRKGAMTVSDIDSISAPMTSVMLELSAFFTRRASCSSRSIPRRILSRSFAAVMP